MTAEDVRHYLSLLPYWTFSLALAGTFYKSTIWIGNHFKPEFRAGLTEWLQGKRDSTWSESFCMLFDTLFGRRHLSLKRLVRSAIASVVAVITLYILFAHVLGVLGTRTFDSMSPVQALLTLLLVNVLADYLALIETRILLDYFKTAQGFATQALLLFFDLLLKSAIAIALIVLSGLLLTGKFPRPIEVAALFSVYSIFFYSSFFPSIWLWLYCASTWFVRLFSRLGLGRLFDIEKEPVKQIALVGAALTLAGGLVLAPVLRAEEGQGSAFDRAICRWDLDSCFAAARASHYAVDNGPVHLFLETACRNEASDGNCADRLERYFGDADLATKILKAACDQNYWRACRAYGWHHWQRLGTEQDLAIAKRVFERACDAGEPGSCANLGVMYESGESVKQNEQTAVNLYRKACDGGDLFGCASLGWMYESGKGVDQNDQAAVDFYRKACDGRDARGCNNLGVMYNNGQGVEHSDETAVDLFRKACDGGEAGGCNNLGVMYEYGQGIDQNEQTAFDLYGKACDGGEARGCAYLGTMYESGQGVDQNDQMAVDLYRKACDSGDTVGCAYLDAAATTP